MNTFRESLMCLVPDGRKLAFSQAGENMGARVLLCLPGLLETRASFDPLLQFASGIQGLRVISLDFCGRGNSDPLPADSGYCMSMYLSDVEAFIRQEIWVDGVPRPHLDILGTSMGGILGMYLAAKADNYVSGLFLNDIGLNLSWMSIYGLYEGMNAAGRAPETETLAIRLGVSEGAVRDVQSPHHFDLPHHKDWKGMKFGHILNNFKGHVSLVYGSESGVCMSQQVQEMQTKFPHLTTMQVEGATHPVPFSESVCAFVTEEALAAKQSPIFAQDALVSSIEVSNLEVIQLETSEDNKSDSVVALEVKKPNNWRHKFAKWMGGFK
jgi:pimeloyl-ACP methyl ester carboxylesterase